MNSFIHNNVVDLLLERGADPNEKALYEYSPIQKNEFSAWELFLIVVNYKNSVFDAVMMSMVQSGADLNAVVGLRRELVRSVDVRNRRPVTKGRPDINLVSAEEAAIELCTDENKQLMKQTIVRAKRRRLMMALFAPIQHLWLMLLWLMRRGLGR